ncbi:putative RND superfamily exporter [Aequorivita sublithincola DSM 14238]|uniref:Putative RND superfamily exporter n=1 Tax=Aequorivita sublithincola (strain DSM 14238 / LMG 21431 / ACAM 643 / 9-3) TaxID=746697 RepID=I3YVC6_AEQSU|nr:efflux RND transporter permease subunit [Aequorivita sublithincola]AFL80944.1 putative RND superfamily exporter [Aequorivita sublithincola DSM 14238]
MNKLFSIGFWGWVARFILRNRTVILIVIAGITVLLALQWKNMRFTYTEANLLPDDHPINLEYDQFLSHFGEEGNLIVMGVKDSTIFTPMKFKAWNQLSEDIGKFSEVEFTLSVGNLKKLEKKKDTTGFELVPFIHDSIFTDANLAAYKDELFNKLPFYDGLIYSPDKKSIRSAIYMKKDVVNTSERKDFVIKDLIPLIKKFEADTGVKVHTSGMPYIRTLNSQSIIDEIGLFIAGALFVTSLIFFFFFRSWRATFISMCTVIIGVMWSFGLLGLMHYEITVLTALIPPLIIVIGIPNCIFLINKYQQEIKLHGNQAKSLQRVISKIGNATLMTNLTTASGFATFILVKSELLSEFGIVASVNIIAIFLLSLLIIPIFYSYLSVPKPKHLKHLNKTWINKFVNWVERMVRDRRITIYIVAILLLCTSIIGIFQIKISGSLIEDMPKNTGFFDDIRFFEKEYEGIMPLEIMVDTKKKKGVMSLSTLKRIDELQDHIKEIPEFAKPISVVELVKYSKQAYYNGNPEYYQLPNSQEKNFILSYAKSSNTNTNLLSSYVDSTGQFARITTFMKDTKPDRFNRIEEDLHEEINKVFPPERYNVSVTGKALVFQKGTHYLVNNLILSLSLAIFLIALFMAWMFRSFKMIMISLIPNLLPLIITAGVMGYLGIPIKPSTILVFSIAFGISVDDTIHFLAKYRQELIANNWKIKKSVYAALRESTVSMFYTSIVLFFGFSVFTISSFGGTVALGGLVSMTLLFAMLSNLLLLPTLLLSLERSIANKETMKKPAIEILTDDGEEIK